MNCDKSLLVSSDTFKSRNFHVPAAGINAGPSYHNDGVKAGVRRVHRRTGVEERLGGGVTRAGHLQHLSPGRMSCCLFNFLRLNMTHGLSKFKIVHLYCFVFIGKL